MPMESRLEIVDWKEELVPLNESKPELIDYFVTKYSQTEQFNNCLSHLKYFDAKAQFNIDNINSKFIKEKHKPIKENFNFLMYYLRSRAKPSTETQIFTYANVLSTIMNTPFEINKEKRKWHLSAKYYGSRIVLYSPDETIPCGPESMYNVLLNKHFFVKKPQHYHRRIISDYDNLSYEIYHLNLSDNNVIYLADNPGIMSENTITSLDELKEAEHGLCDVYEKAQDIMNFNPYTWSKAALINAKHCIVGFYSKDKDNLEDIINFTADKFNDKAKYENLWSPIAAWNFLDLFLTFVNIEADRFQTKSEMLLEFKSYPNDERFVICEHYRNGIDNRGYTFKTLLSDGYMKI